MKVAWSCTFLECKHPKEETSSYVPNIPHRHGGIDYPMIPFKRPRKAAGEISVKSLKKEVWDLFAEWKRRSVTDEYGYCQCVTCGKRDKWQNMQAGHYIHGTLFLIPDLVHVQCYHCNINLNGNLIAYHNFMLKKYGQKAIDKMEWQAKGRHTFTIFGLQQYKKMYQEEIKNLP